MRERSRDRAVDSSERVNSARMSISLNNASEQRVRVVNVEVRKGDCWYNVSRRDANAHSGCFVSFPDSSHSLHGRAL